MIPAGAAFAVPRPRSFDWSLQIVPLSGLAPCEILTRFYDPMQEDGYPANSHHVSGHATIFRTVPFLASLTTRSLLGAA